jgi:hypothetical protein
VGQKTGWATDVNGATETEWQRKGRKRNTGQLFAGLAATDFEGGLVLHFGQEHQNIRTSGHQNIRRSEHQKIRRSKIRTSEKKKERGPTRTLPGLTRTGPGVSNTECSIGNSF